MREILDSIRDNLLSQKVVIIADTCHSAAIGGDIGRRSRINSTAIVNKYFEELAKSEEGTALLTSAEANEVAFEDKKWGGGHGVFTHFLLEGLSGKADGYGGGKKDGIISIGELFEYVRDKVKEDTEYKQHPLIGSSRYDRNLPLYFTDYISDTKGISPSFTNSIDLSPKQRHELYGIQFDNKNSLARQLGNIKTGLHSIFSNKRKSKRISITITISIIAITAVVIGMPLILQQQPYTSLTDNQVASDVDVLFDAALSSYKLGQYSEAVDSLNKVLQIDPNNVTAQFLKGSSLYNAENYNNAHESFKQLIQLDPNNTEALYYDGLSLYNLERYSDAISEFNRILASEPSNINTLLYKGLSLYNLERYNEAVAYYDRVLEIDPNNPNATKEKERIQQQI
jgi:tetratricopeptide (TPR) repeat protein